MDLLDLLDGTKTVARWGVVMLVAVGCGDDTTNADAGDSGPGTTAGDTGPGTTGGSTVGGSGSGDTAADSTDAGTTIGGSTMGSTGTGDSGTTMGLGTTGGSTDGESTDTESTDTGVMLDGCYDPADYPYAGALCGPAGMPCQLLVDEDVDGVPHFRNGAPSIVLDDACDPQVLYSIAEGGFTGRFARRLGPDSWDDTQTPFSVARGGLGFDATAGDTMALPYDGAFGVEVWRWNGQWVMEDTLPGQQLLRSRSVTHDGTGTMYAGLVTSQSDLVSGRWDGAWNLTNIDVQVNASAVARGPSDSTHLAYWTSTNGTWQMLWAIAGQAPELVAPLGSNVLFLGEHGIAVVDDAGSGIPHLTFATQSVGGGLHEVVYATRTGPGTWDVVPVASESQAANDTCNTPPQGPGQQCNYDYIRMRPLDIIASAGGDIRIFYARDHFMGSVQSVCMPGPGGGFCEWQPLADNSTSDLHIAWPDGVGVANAVVVPDRRVQSMTSAMDIAGQMHVAAYVGQGNSEVHYLRVGEQP